MNKQKYEKTRGVVGAELSKSKFELKRFFPSEHLQHFIEHYWLISWDLPQGVVHKQQVISHPCVHLTFLRNDSSITGIVSKQFEHVLRGSDNLVGVRFTPAGFYAFAKQSNLKMSDVTDNILPIDRVFDVEINVYEKQILALSKLTDKTEKLETELFSNLPELDPNVVKLNQIVKQIETDRSILKASDICQKFDLEERQLQRLFSKYIGISAKWIINRYRIHEALEQIETTKRINWSDLAVSLGYYDQAHFINDFKNLVGSSPDSYLRKLDQG